jgi:DNA-binding XRE family transcriptional regulator
MKEVTTLRPSYEERKIVFASYMKSFVRAHGGHYAVAAMLETSPGAVRAWMRADGIPYLRVLMRLIKVYELTDVEANRLLNAAGKPPITQLRRRMAYGTADLPTLLCEYREELGEGTQAAADVFRMPRSEFSRMANGSARPRTVRMVHRIAQVLGITDQKVIVAAALEHSELAVKVRVATTGMPGVVRDMIAELNCDSFEKDGCLEAARLLGVRYQRVRNFLVGTATPTFKELHHMATVTRFPLEKALECAGFSTQIAERLSKVNPYAPVQGSFAELLRFYRQQAGLTQAALSMKCPSVAKGNTIAQYETGRHTPNETIIVEVADALRAPLEELFAASFAA